MLCVVGRPDFPRTIIEFQSRFPDEAACWEYLAQSRWPDGYRCPRCGCQSAAVLGGRRLWQCSACRHQVSVTAGTVLHKTHTPLQLWFWAAYLMSTPTPGVRRTCATLLAALEVHPRVIMRSGLTQTCR